VLAKLNQEGVMEPDKRSVTLTIAWVILLVVGLLMILGGAESLIVAYRGGNETIAGVSSETLAQINPELPKALRGRRATAAAYAVSCGLLVAWISVTAFRRRQKWAWYGLLCSLGAGAVLSALRIPLMNYRPGSETAGVILAALIIALGISYRDFK
jgi:multisubunit Na+/H+ antiporter MnhB subunit